MAVAWHAGRRPDHLALATSYGDRTFRELNEHANQLARLLARHGIGTGAGHDDGSIAVVTKNRPEFVEAYCAALRSGIRFTPVNWHLTGEETGYIIDNCEAQAVIYDASLGTAEQAAAHAADCNLRLAVGGSIPGFLDYRAGHCRRGRRRRGKPRARLADAVHLGHHRTPQGRVPQPDAGAPLLRPSPWPPAIPTPTAACARAPRTTLRRSRSTWWRPSPRVSGW